MPYNTFRIRVESNPINSMKSALVQISQSLQWEFEQEGETVANKMVANVKDYIDSNVKRPNTGKLGNSIEVYPLVLETALQAGLSGTQQGGVAFGIGKISDMPDYWEYVNDGGVIPHDNLGFFAGGLGLSGERGSPTPGGEGEEWVHTGDSSDFLLKPRKPTEPLQYIWFGKEELHRLMVDLLKDIESKSK